jgi:ribosome-associated toxin RatA of RatAB toxin-antitoxin module
MFDSVQLVEKYLPLLPRCTEQQALNSHTNQATLPYNLPIYFYVYLQVSFLNFDHQYFKRIDMPRSRYSICLLRLA